MGGTMTASAHRPNLIFFIPDELRASSVGCYGDPVSLTPNIDRLASQGTRFDESIWSIDWRTWATVR
ncbi:MAG: hypothetical protein EB140_05880 [Proteobacteria bacterium]|nr:hypothetical protein [Pseudomonadota bacterium]